MKKEKFVGNLSGSCPSSDILSLLGQGMLYFYHGEVVEIKQGNFETRPLWQPCFCFPPLIL